MTRPVARDPRPEGDFDYVIVGSGAAGAAAARVLVDTGASVAIVEEGARVGTDDLGNDALRALTLYREMGTFVTRGRAAIPLFQGVCLGGSTVVNSAIARRMPERVWDEWADRFGLARAVPFESLEEHWQLLERELSAAPTPEAVWGGNSTALARGAQALGLRGAPTTRFVRDCAGSANCTVGCRHGAKQSMHLTYLPYAEARGAAVFTGARVTRVRLSGDRAVAIEGEIRAGDPMPGSVAHGGRNGLRGHRSFRLGARKGIVLAASALQTPLILARSGISSKHLGRHFQAHPGVLLLGLFDHQVDMWSGATQGFEVEVPGEDPGFKIESLALPPELILPRLPGVGRRWQETLGEARHLAGWAVLLRAQAKGTVRTSQLTGGVSVHYDLTDSDMVRLRQGMRVAAELFFAAGAKEVLPQVHGLPERLTSPDHVALFDTAPSDPACYSFSSSHFFGTARMSVDRSAGIVGPDFGVHGTQGLYVLDSSLFPTNLGVNPQHTIMAVAMHGALRMAQA